MSFITIISVIITVPILQYIFNKFSLKLRYIYIYIYALHLTESFTVT